MARAMDIPVVGRVAGCLGRVETGDPVILDADNAQVFVRPTENVRALFETGVRDRAKRRALYAALHDVDPVSRDGVRISLNQNAGLLVELNDFSAHGVDGVGLYRTEIPFMVRQNFPDVGEQAEIYMRVLAAAEGAPVVFRTLDIGGDKVLPYLRDPKDDNPAMGWRAIRIGLDRPAILRHQLRAMIRAAAGQSAAVSCFRWSPTSRNSKRRAVWSIWSLSGPPKAGNLLPASLSVGVMLEVPALVWQLPALVERADFVSARKQ